MSLVILAVAVLGFLLVCYVVHRVDPSHFKLSASVLKLLSLSIEVKGKGSRQDRELPPGPADESESRPRPGGPKHRARGLRERDTS